MRMTHLSFRTWLLAATSLTASGLTAAAPAMAQTSPAPTASPAAPAAPAADAPPPGYWINGIHLSAQLQAGILANPAGPKLNDGHLFTDRPNTPMLNQILIGAEKKLDPKATGWDWGFKVSAMYGSDARYIHTLGLTEQALPKDQRNQIDIVEVSGSIHFPGIGEGGLDLKAGMYVTPLGYELIDPATNAFYSHSYIFNYGLPFKHTGFILTEHLTSVVDLYLGLDTGTNTTFGPNGETNSSLGGIVGFGLNLMEGNLTILALSHIGAEQASRALSPVYSASKYLRSYNDVVVTWKVNDKMTVAGEIDYARDEFGGIITRGRPTAANAFGVAGYVSYATSDTLTLNARVEVFRDDNGFFVARFPGNYDNVNAQKGLANTSVAAVPATYGSITLGLTYKPPVPAVITGLVIRPEVRFDQSLGGNKTFNYSNVSRTYKDSSAFTVGSDFVLTF